MSETELFQSFDNHKLIDIVKNYRRYKYDERLRSLAIRILNERGISEEDLKLTGNFENRSYDNAENTYKSYGRSSVIAFALYLLLVALNIFLHTGYAPAGVGMTVFYVLLSIGYLLMVLRSFIEYSNFFKAIGKETDAGGPLLYIFVGMPFYFVMYFYYRNHMKEEMQLTG